MGREKESRMAKSQSKAGTGQPMGRENRQKEPESQSKTDMRTTKWPTKGNKIRGQFI